MPLQCPICTEAEDTEIDFTEEEVMPKLVVRSFACKTCGTVIVNSTLSKEEFIRSLQYCVPPKGKEFKDSKFN